MVMEALDVAFAANDEGVLFNLPVTQGWLDQLVLSLTLICRSSCRGVKELLRDMFDLPVSIGTIHLLQQHVRHQADHDHRRHALHQHGQFRHSALVRHELGAALHQFACAT